MPLWIYLYLPPLGLFWKHSPSRAAGSALVLAASGGTVGVLTSGDGDGCADRRRALALEPRLSGVAPRDLLLPGGVGRGGFAGEWNTAPSGGVWIRVTSGVERILGSGVGDLKDFERAPGVDAHGETCGFADRIRENMDGLGVVFSGLFTCNIWQKKRITFVEDARTRTVLPHAHFYAPKTSPKGRNHWFYFQENGLNLEQDSRSYSSAHNNPALFQATTGCPHARSVRSPFTY